MRADVTGQPDDRDGDTGNEEKPEHHEDILV